MLTVLQLKNEIWAYQVVDTVLRRGLRVLPAWQWTGRLALWWGYRFKPAAGVVRLRSGARIGVSATDYLQLLIYYQGTFEPHCLPYLRICARKGDTVVDVGANIGFYTLESALAVGEAGRVIAIEAAPPHIETLRKNVRLNAMNCVSLVDTAVSDAVDEATLALPKGDNLGMFTLGRVESDEAYRVALRPLDDVLDEQRIDSLALIKMDIEGSEYRALRGAARTLAKYKPALLLELNEFALSRCGSSAQEVRALLHEAGYRGWVIGRRRLRPLAAAQARQDCDECLFVHRDSEILLRRLGVSEKLNG
jgi:FkbM family methyltransferase